MSDKFWHGRILHAKTYPTVAQSPDEAERRLVDFVTEASITLDMSGDFFADVREMVSDDVLDAAVLNTDNGAKA